MSENTFNCFECDYENCETHPNVKICENAFIVSFFHNLFDLII